MPFNNESRSGESAWKQVIFIVFLENCKAAGPTPQTPMRDVAKARGCGYVRLYSSPQ